LFKFDSKTGNIVSYDDANKAVTIQSNGKNRNLKFDQRGNDWFKVFRYEDDGHITNSRGKCFDVNRRRDREGESVIVWRRYNHNNQKWDIEYVDPNAKIDYGFKDG